MQNPGLEPRSVPPPPPAVPGAAAARPTNSLAVVSLVAGIVSFFPLPHPFIGGIVAILTGHMALGQVRQTGEAGRELALIGVVLGYIHLALSVLLVVAVILLLAGVLSLAFFSRP